MTAVRSPEGGGWGPSLAGWATAALHRLVERAAATASNNRGEKGRHTMSTDHTRTRDRTGNRTARPGHPHPQTK